MMSAQTNRQVQAYFAYDSKKSGGYTVSHLRIGEAPIRAPYLIGQADFLACHQPTLMNLDVVAQSVKPGGTVLLNLPDGMEFPRSCAGALRNAMRCCTPSTRTQSRRSAAWAGASTRSCRRLSSN